jgi:hypothetical protein
MYSLLSLRSLAAVAALAVVSVVPAAAQTTDLSESKSCFRGAVPVADYHEFESSLGESATDTRGGYSLTADSYGLVLEVRDAAGNEACTDDADKKAKCTLRSGVSQTALFTFKVTNETGASEVGYRLCAF